MRGRLIARAGKRALFHPQDLSRSVLKAWWCADDHGTSRMTDDGSGLISNWVDRIQGLAVTAATTARPTWSANAFNGAYPGITFDGVANCFVTTSLGGLPTGSTPGEIWAVLSAVSSATITTPLSYGDTGAAARRMDKKATTDFPLVSDGVTQNGGGSTLVGPNIICGNLSGTTANLFQNGSPSVNNPKTIASLNTGTARLRIGALHGAAAANFFAGVITDAVILSGILSAANRAKLEGYFAWLYGMQSVLPAHHPYRLSPP